MLTYNFMFFFSLVLNFFFRRNVFWKFYQKILRCYAYMNQYMFLIKLILVEFWTRAMRRMRNVFFVSLVRNGVAHYAKKVSNR